MKNIKTLFVAACLVFFSMAVNAQINTEISRSSSYVTSLDQKVTLTDDQKSQVTELFNNLMTELNGLTPAQVQDAKVALNEEVRRVLTPAQIARLESPLRRRQ